jgi:hypothetical protein
MRLDPDLDDLINDDEEQNEPCDNPVALASSSHMRCGMTLLTLVAIELSLDTLRRMRYRTETLLGDELARDGADPISAVLDA